MTGKTTKIFLGLTAAVAVLATPLLLAGGDRSGRNCALGIGQRAHGAVMQLAGFGSHGRGMHADALFHDLDLTREQREQIHAIFMGARERTEPTREALHAGLVDTARVLAAEPGNVAGARAAFDARQPAIEELKAGLFTTLADTMAVLTPEQRAKLLAHLERHGHLAAE